MNSIILINLPIQTYLQKSFDLEIQYNPSLGLISLGTWLEFNGYEPHILDLCYSKMTAQNLIDYISETKPLFIGISVYTENIEMAISTAKLIKNKFPSLPIVLGGPHPTLMPQDAISSEYVDFVVRKEGESILLELAEAIRTNENAIKYEDIQGVVFKKQGEIIKNKLRNAVTDLDIFPLLKRELVGIDKYYEVINISTSRGCPGNCIYCSATALSGAVYRTRCIENVFLEIVLLKTCLKGKVDKFYFVDDTFTAVTDRVIRFIELIHKYDLKILWHCESRVDVMKEELIDKMASSGCMAIQYGIESGSQEVLNKIEKGMDLNRAKQIIDYTYKKQIVPCLSFMVGHFCDTVETMEETYEFIKEMYEKYKAEMALSFNTPFPGTWQYVNREKIGIKLITEKYKRFSLLDPIVETDNFTAADQRNIFFKTRKYLVHSSKYSQLKKEIFKNGE